MSKFVKIPKSELLKLEEARMLLWDMVDKCGVSEYNVGQVTSVMLHLANFKWEESDKPKL